MYKAMASRMHNWSNNLSFVALTLSLLITTQSEAAAKPTEQRKLFVEAEKALDKGEMESYKKLKASLLDYPLLPYLISKELAKDIDKTQAAKIDAYLKQYDDTSSAFLLRSAWLNHLAKSKRWKEFAKYYKKGGGTGMKCLYIQALINNGDKKKAYESAASVWLTGRSLPKLCDPIFQQMHKEGKLTPKLVWQRTNLIRDTRGKKRASLLRYMKKLLPRKEHGYHDLWMQTLSKQPQKILESPLLKKNHPSRGDLLVHTLSRLGWRDRNAALTAWNKYRNSDLLDAGQKLRIQRELGRALSRRKHPRATEFLDDVDKCWMIQGLCELRFQHALKKRDWRKVVAWIEDMPIKTQQRVRWSYWKARALELQGKKLEAEKLFKEVAKDRSYFGYLAADRVDAPYKLAHKRVSVTQQEMDDFAKLPGIRRAKELFLLDRTNLAHGEWNRVIHKLDNQGLKTAARTALQWGWNDKAIYNLMKTGYWDDLEIRFPLTYRKQVEQLAESYNIDAAWIFAVMRQESTFVPNALSPVGAMGLMQLMPATAREVSRKLKMGSINKSRILQPETNIRLGSSYLKQLHDQFNGWLMLATPSYNAGSKRTLRWLPDKAMPADLWVELIPFDETRLYVKRVLSYVVLYEYRLGKEITRLRERMPNVDKSLLTVKRQKKEPKKVKAGAKSASFINH
jgi:soluble lytic murein transglycosylase